MALCFLQQHDLLDMQHVLTNNLPGLNFYLIDQLLNTPPPLHLLKGITNLEPYDP